MTMGHGIRVEAHIAEAERLLTPRDAYYNGGQTHRVELPSEPAVQRALAHATLAQALIQQDAHYV